MAINNLWIRVKWWTNMASPDRISRTCFESSATEAINSKQVRKQKTEGTIWRKKACSKI